MRLNKTSRYAIVFLALLVLLVVALGPLVAMRREGFSATGIPCDKDPDCPPERCGRGPGSERICR